MVLTILKTKGVQFRTPGLTVVADPESEVKEGVALMTKTALPIANDIPMNVLAGPGEYEISGVRIKGIAFTKESDEKHIQTGYVFGLDGMRTCFLGEISKELEDEAVNEIGDIDILCVQTGDNLLEPKKMRGLIQQIDPRSVVIFGGEKDAQALADEMGQKLEKEEKLSIKKKDVSEEGIHLVWIRK